MSSLAATTDLSGEQGLAQERARLQQEIASGKRELKQAVHEIAAPLKRMERSHEQLTHFMRQYSLMLLPAAVLMLLHPRASLRVAARVLSLWTTWRRYRGLPQASGALTHTRH
jgi:hypothetical protein